MTSSMTPTGVCNMALDILKHSPINSIDDEDANAERFKRNFDTWRDAFLAMHTWNFAVTRASLPTDTTSPAFRWKYQYLLPGACLRMLTLTSDGEFESPNIDHEVEGGYILTNATAPLNIRYIARIEQMGSWSPSCVVAFSAFLAFNVAHAVTGKASYEQLAGDRYMKALKVAKRTDGLQGSVERADTNDVIAVRY